jgi:TetR/AcrR family transcriptional regulator, repressor of fatR-cypB operon
MNIHSAFAMPSAHPTLDESRPKRDVILNAALELFAERGFHGTAVPLVAERAKVGAGTLYRYFDSKEALVNALYQREKTCFLRELVTDFPIDAPPREQFRVFWRRLVDYAQRHPLAAVFLELHHHSPYLDPESHALEQRVLQPVVDFILRAQEHQALKPVEPMLLISMVYGAFLGIAKAVWSGQLQLTPTSLDEAEACMWEAVRR